MTTGRINQVTNVSTIRRQCCAHTELSQKPKLPESQAFVTIRTLTAACLEAPVLPGASPLAAVSFHHRNSLRSSRVTRCLTACLKVMLAAACLEALVSKSLTTSRSKIARL